MDFFHNLNQRLAKIANPETLNESVAPVAERATGDYSAKKARAGKDIGKPGKMFSKIAKSAGKEYGSKERGEKVAGAVLAKLRKGVKEDGMEEGNAFSGAVAKAKADGVQPGEKITVGGKQYPVKEAGPMTPKQKSFAKLAPPVDKITFADKIAGAKKEVDEMLGDVAAEAIKKAVKKSEPRSKGTAFDADFMKQQQAKKDAESHSRYDVTDTGYSKRYTRKAVDTDIDAGDEVKSDAPKKKGRPKGKDKGPERVTAKSYKYKSGRPVKTAEDLDTDGVMMTRPSNMSSESVDHGEYDREGDMAKEQMHTIMSAAKELHSILSDEENLPEWVQKKISLAQEYIDAARDYMLSQHAEREEGMAEVAPPGAKAERMVKHIKKAYSKDGKLTPKEKAIAYATTWKAKKAGKVEEESTDKEDTKAERAGKKVAKDIEYDEGHKGKDDAKAEKAGKQVTKDIEYDDKKDKKEKKVAETTVAGSVATAPAGKKSSGGYNFGGGVYESLDKKYRQALTEGMNISVNMNAGEDGQARKSITVSADGAEAEALAQLLKMAGLDSHQETCPACGSADCGCESIDENSPDWPTNTEKLDAEPNLRTYSGGLNGPKSTGQTTVPVVASQERRLHSESVDLESNLFKLYQNYKAQ